MSEALKWTVPPGVHEIVFSSGEARDEFVPVVPGTTYSFTIGAGGVGGSFLPTSCAPGRGVSIRERLGEPFRHLCRVLIRHREGEPSHASVADT